MTSADEVHHLREEMGSTNSWWLALVKEQSKRYAISLNLHHRVMFSLRFLREQGVDFHAVPERYLDEPPSNMAAVRQNLEVVRRALAVCLPILLAALSHARVGRR